MLTWWSASFDQGPFMWLIYSIISLLCWILGAYLMFIVPGLQFYGVISPFNPTVDTALKPLLQKNCAESLINLQVFNNSCKKLCKLEADTLDFYDYKKRKNLNLFLCI